MPRDREDDTEHITSERPTGGPIRKAGEQGGAIPKAGAPQGSGAIPKAGEEHDLSKTGGKSGSSPTTPTTTPAPSAARTYTVKAGDSLSKIAKELYGDAGKWKQIYEANKGVIGSNPDLIKPGQVLTIP